jgi:indole-3-glycerol phosphate synthase/phosphoribosylanthranilate isomerase
MNLDVLLAATGQLSEGTSIDAANAEALFTPILQGEFPPERLAPFLVALAEKGEATSEILGAARAARALATPFPVLSTPVIDVCGTGGDGLGTINLSTTSAFVLAAAGLSVAKHGNRSVTSACGSADVLEALGIPLELEPARAAEAIEETRFAFLFAPLYHSGFRHVAAVRKGLGRRTIFNLLGPLLNPAAPRTQLVGVFDARFLRPLAEVLAALGVVRAQVVHGDGLDEVAPHAKTQFVEVVNGIFAAGHLDPALAGVAPIPLAALRGGDAVENAAILTQILAGTAEAPHADAVALNAGASLALARGVPFADGVKEARELLASGAPKGVLDAHRRFFARVSVDVPAGERGKALAEMPDVLKKIVARKRVDVAARKEACGALPPRAEAHPADHRFARALGRRAARHTAFILEVKKGSPSQGVLRGALDVDEILAAYTGVADALSVLTDKPFFGGSFEILREVRAKTNLPVLCKDFVVDLWQIDEAHAHGADAVLLMLSVLSDEEVAAGLARAKNLGIDALVEAHTEDELARALRLDAPIIGINNRDLRTLKTDLATTERLALRVPDDRLLISESGIASRADVARLGRHVDGFLVGSSLMGAGDVHGAARALAFGRVKVCGLRRPEDVAALPALGVAYAGFVFVPETPRFVPLADSEKYVQTAWSCPRVGVFRGASVAEIAAHVAAFGLRAVQLHGEPPPLDAPRAALPPAVEIWQVVDGATVDLDALLSGGLDRYLLDTGAGGSGISWDHARISVHPARGSFIVAGGISAENARSAYGDGVFALDASSRLESAVGIKDRDKIVALIDALREPSRRGIQR